jgi:hypothetical protein
MSIICPLIVKTATGYGNLDISILLGLFNGIINLQRVFKRGVG